MIQWKGVYLDIAKTLLARGGGGAVGHHTLHVADIERKLIPKYDKDTIKAGIGRLIKKDDLLVWPKTAKLPEENSSVSINPARLEDLEQYLKGHPKWYARLKDLEKEIGSNPEGTINMLF